MAHDGGHVEDASVASAEHGGDEGARHEEGRDEAGVDDAAEFVEREVDEVFADVGVAGLRPRHTPG